jgi:hypothetical protein
MSAHPEIDLVSRDGGREYASAAASGAPQATQCADRFHLLKNLREDLEGCLARHLAVKRQEKTQEILDTPAPAWQAVRSPRISRSVEQIQQNRREERLARYQEVIALHRQGMSQAAIAHQVGMGASTVQSRASCRRVCLHASHVNRAVTLIGISHSLSKEMGRGMPQYDSSLSRTRGARLQGLVCECA